MENLDALLEDLQATRQHVLRQNSASLLPSNLEPSPEQSNFWSSDNNCAHRPSRNSTHMPRIPLQENLSQLDRMLDDLEKQSDEYQTQDFDNSSSSPHYELYPDPVPPGTDGLSSSTSNGPATNGGSSGGPISQRTKEAAAQASRQLDELMNSLQQLREQSSPNRTPSNTIERGPLQLQATDLLDSPSPEEPVPSTSRAYEQRNGHGDATYSGVGFGDDDRVNDGNPASSIEGAPGMCLHCNQPVTGKVITALGGVWHPEHFACAYCQANVVNDFFYEHDGAPYCTECHLSVFAPKCAFCGEAITDRCLEAMGYFWHPNHFFCQGCHSPFVDNATAHEHKGKVFCSECYFSNFGERCGGCRQPIQGAYITALEQPWHEDCFRCKDCGELLSGQSFHADDGFLYCETHHRRNSGMVCAACQEPISGARCISALGKRYHLQHFACTYCLRQLHSGTFKERAGKPYCPPCFRQLFG